MSVPASPGSAGFAATAAVPSTVDAHLEAILAVVQPLPELDLTLLDAHGCVLAEDVVATESLPNFDNAQMDGYAVRAADLATATGATPVTLPVVADIAAGSRGTYSVQPGLTARIMTGAPMPAGADAVVPVEWTDGGLVNVAISRAAVAGSYVRKAGEDAMAGSVVLSAGTYLQAAQLGLIAAVGRPRVRARPKPRVVIVSTGSELAELGEPLLPGQIYDSNGYALAAAAREAGAIAFRVGPVGDDPKLLISTIEDQLIRADIVVTTGGVSVGAHDVVREVIGRIGDVTFSKVAMQPGQPQAFGTIGEDKVPFFGLPGNPVSALVSFEVFVRPAIRRLLGSEPIQRPRVRARLTQALTSPAGRRQFVRVRLSVEDGDYVATPVGGAGSHLIASMAHANALAVVPEEITDLPVGTPVPVMVLERRHGVNEPRSLTHVDAAGAARMVDVSAKEVSRRSAVATGRVVVSAEVVGLLRGDGVPKGDALGVARIAGIMAAKRTPDLVPLCHPIALSGVEVALTVLDDAVAIEATVRTTDRTGVEMEALTAVSVAGLALIDMVKAIDPAATITDVRVETKTGGVHGDWQRRDG